VGLTILDVKVLDRLAAAVGYAPLAVSLAAEQYASPWADASHLETIALNDLFGFAESIRVSRLRAMQVPTLAAARHTIVNTAGRLPLFAEKNNVRGVTPAFGNLSQFERGVPRATTLGNIYDALFWYPCTWLHVLERDAYGWPRWAEWVRDGRATRDSDGNLAAVDDKPVNPADVIRIDSPLGSGILVNAERTIKRSIAIEEAAALAEDNPVPTIELHNEGDKLTKQEIADLMDVWQASRRKRGVAYTSKGIKAIPHGAQQSQLLVEGRKALNLDLIRHANVPAWAASAANEGATMSYENRGSRNWELIDLTLSAYFTAFAGRLSLPDVTPLGWTVKVDTDELTKPDQKTRFETYKAGKEGGFIDNAWIAEQEGWERVPAEKTKEPNA
jgi:hypothetical protein